MISSIITIPESIKFLKNSFDKLTWKYTVMVIFYHLCLRAAQDRSKLPKITEVGDLCDIRISLSIVFLHFYDGRDRNFSEKREALELVQRSRANIKFQSKIDISSQIKSVRLRLY